MQKSQEQSNILENIWLKADVPVGFDNPSSNTFSNITKFDELCSKLSDHVCTEDENEFP